MIGSAFFLLANGSITPPPSNPPPILREREERDLWSLGPPSFSTFSARGSGGIPPTAAHRFLPGFPSTKGGFDAPQNRAG